MLCSGGGSRRSANADRVPSPGSQAGRQGRGTVGHRPLGGAWSARRCGRCAASGHRRTRHRDAATGSRARRIGSRCGLRRDSRLDGASLLAREMPTTRWDPTRAGCGQSDAALGPRTTHRMGRTPRNDRRSRVRPLATVTAVLAATNVVPSGMTATRAVGSCHRATGGGNRKRHGHAARPHAVPFHPGQGIDLRRLVAPGGAGIGHGGGRVRATGARPDRARTIGTGVRVTPMRAGRERRWGPPHEAVVPAWDVLLVLLEAVAPWEAGRASHPANETTDPHVIPALPVWDGATQTTVGAGTG
jgi:hypothetical protein